MEKAILILIFATLIFYVDFSAQENQQIKYEKDSSSFNVVRRDGFYETINYKGAQTHSATEFTLKPAILIQEIDLVNVNVDQFGAFLINIEFNKFGTNLFHDLTLKNIGRPIGLFIESELISSPIVNMTISEGRVVLQGGYTNAEASKIEKLINQKINN